jgi:hypothetical protein
MKYIRSWILSKVDADTRNVRGGVTGGLEACQGTIEAGASSEGSWVEEGVVKQCAGHYHGEGQVVVENGHVDSD